MQGGFHKGVVSTLHHDVEQGVNAFGQALLFQLRNAGQRMAGLQQLEHFVKQTALWHIGQQLERALQGCRGFALQLKAQARQLSSETHRADDAHGVFAVTGGGVANHAQHFFLGVGNAPVVVDDALRFGVVIHRVDGEVTARSVFVLRAPHVVAQHAATRIDSMLHAREFLFAAAFVALDLFGVGTV